MRQRGGGGSLPVSLLFLAAALCLSLVKFNPAQGSTPPPVANWTRNGSSSGSPPPRQAGYPDSSVVRRALWVLLGISGLGLLYFIVRSIRLKKSQRKKYGLLSSYDDHVEMAPMDTDDDDTTLFEVKGMRR